MWHSQTGYSPKNGWNKERLSNRARFNIWLSNVVIGLLTRWPAVTKGSRDLRWLAPMLDSSNRHSRIINKPDTVTLRLVAMQVYWLIPVENLELVRRGLFRLRKKHGASRFGRDIADEEFHQKFENAADLAQRFSSFLGHYELDGIPFELRLTNSLSHYVTLSAQLEFPEADIQRFNKVLETQYVDQHRVIFPWERSGAKKKTWALHWTPAKYELARHVEEFMLDLKWRIHKLITLYCGDDAFVSNDPIPSLEMYICPSGFPAPATLSIPERQFWEALNAFHSVDDFYTDDRLYHFFLGKMWSQDRPIADSLRVVVDANKAVVSYHLSNAEDVEPREKEELRHWEARLGTLWALHVLSARTVSEVSNLRGQLFGRLSQSGLATLIRGQRDVNSVSQRLLRLSQDCESSRLAEGFSGSVPQAKSLRMQLDISTWLSEDISIRIKEANAQLSLLQSLARQEVELRLLTTNARWQWITFLVAALSLIAAVVALLPETTRQHLIPDVMSWFKETASHIGIKGR